MRQTSIYLLLGLAAGLLLLFITQRLATNLKTSLQALQEQRLERLQDQIDYVQEHPNRGVITAAETYQEQLKLIESHADIITEREADYLETMGHHSPDLRDQFPHVTQAELWDAVYQKELNHLDEHGRISQRILDQLKDSEERSEAIKRIFGDLKEQSKCQ